MAAWFRVHNKFQLFERPSFVADFSRSRQGFLTEIAQFRLNTFLAAIELFSSGALSLQ